MTPSCETANWAHFVYAVFVFILFQVKLISLDVYEVASHNFPFCIFKYQERINTLIYTVIKLRLLRTFVTAGLLEIKGKFPRHLAVSQLGFFGVIYKWEKCKHVKKPLTFLSTSAPSAEHWISTAQLQLLRFNLCVHLYPLTHHTSSEQPERDSQLVYG